jgi:hypothetical protein
MIGFRAGPDALAPPGTLRFASRLNLGVERRSKFVQFLFAQFSGVIH